MACETLLKIKAITAAWKRNKKTTAQAGSDTTVGNNTETSSIIAESTVLGLIGKVSFENTASEKLSIGISGPSRLKPTENKKNGLEVLCSLVVHQKKIGNLEKRRKIFIKTWSSLELLKLQGRRSSRHRSNLENGDCCTEQRSGSKSVQKELYASNVGMVFRRNGDSRLTFGGSTEMKVKGAVRLNTQLERRIDKTSFLIVTSLATDMTWGTAYINGNIEMISLTEDTMKLTDSRRVQMEESVANATYMAGNAKSKQIHSEDAFSKLPCTVVC